MADFNHGAFVKALRKRRKTIPADLYADLMAALDAGLGGGGNALPRNPGAAEPDWLAEARKHIGEKEIPGARHSSFVMGMLAALGGPFTDDETPWCGTFVAYCMLKAGHDPVKHWYRAKAWLDWGKPVPISRPCLGALAIYGRDGGGHGNFLVGESATHWYGVGGNQSNAVNIMPIAKSRLLGLRWPSALPLSTTPLPMMTGGTVSRNEA
jgi:uncharacterized protein (TIGR02594 family)